MTCTHTAYGSAHSGGDHNGTWTPKPVERVTHPKHGAGHVKAAGPCGASCCKYGDRCVEVVFDGATGQARWGLYVSADDLTAEQG